MDSLTTRFNFFKNLMYDPHVAALTSSSRYVVGIVLERLPDQMHTVLEYGPGNGVMTKALLPRLIPEGKLIAIESNRQFVNALKQISDERLTICEGKIEHVINKKISHLKGVNAVVSSIPFSHLKPADRFRVVAATETILAQGGDFIIFHQYSRLMLKPLQKYFRSVSVIFELRNVFPCFILHAKK